jgi:3-oxoacyl-[acyl-carrier protein] reductase
MENSVINGDNFTIMKRLCDKIAIVTGASRGIGRAVAERLGKEGASVIVNYAGNVDKATEVVSAIKEAGGKASAVQGDMSEPDDIATLFKRAEELFGRPDIVVHCAAISFFKPHLLVLPEEFEKVMKLNVRGVFHLLQTAASHVKDGGRIVQFSSGATKMPLPGAGLYSASKAAGEQFALSLAKELGARGITVNLVSPGVTRTDGLIMPEEHLQHLIQQTPLGRLGMPTDIADVVAFLVSDEARWVNGQNLQVNGGIL